MSSASTRRTTVRAAFALTVAAAAGLNLTGCTSGSDVRDLEYLAWVDAGAVGSVEYGYTDELGKPLRTGKGVTASSWVQEVRGGPRLTLTVTSSEEATAHCAIVDRTNHSMLVVRNGRVGESITCKVG